jgi:hypothetical protein
MWLLEKQRTNGRSVCAKDEKWDQTCRTGPKSLPQHDLQANGDPPGVGPGNPAFEILRSCSLHLFVEDNALV